MQHLGTVERGHTVAVRVKAEDSARRVVREGTVTAGFWAPGRDPVGDPEIAAHPDHAVPCEFSARDRGWTAQVSTEGWAPGDWTVRGMTAAATVYGPARGWAWGILRVTLAASLAAVTGAGFRGRRACTGSGRRPGWPSSSPSPSRCCSWQCTQGSRRHNTIAA